MINNEMKNQLSRYFNRANQNETGSMAADLYKRLKNRHDAIHGKNTEDAEAAATEQEAAEASKKQNRVGKGVLRNTAEAKAKEEEAKTKKTKDYSDAGSKKKTAAKDDQLSPEERRKMELKAILDKLEAEEAGKYPYRSGKKDKTEETSTVVTTENAAEASENEGFSAFLNDLPLFNEFKTGLMDAFKRLDGAAAGSISAQYELNYTSMKYVANAAGGYDYEETSFNIKLDLNYIKAAGGGNATGKDLAAAIEGSTDMASLIENLKNAGQNQGAQGAEATKFDPNDLMGSLQDYFSPEKTADRIVDFATAFFPTSDQFKAKGDTPEAREEFAEIMRKAIQKGFDQAMGTLGAVPKETQDGIDKTHELVFKGIDDFVKNGLNKDKQNNGVYSALEQFTFAAQVNYSKKTVSVRPASEYYANEAKQNEYANQTKQNDTTQSALDTQA